MVPFCTKMCAVILPVLSYFLAFVDKQIILKIIYAISTLFDYD